MRTAIIDDDRGLCRSLQLHLERLGDSVLIAHSVVDGARLLTKELPDLTFVDLDLPDGTGMDLLKHIRNQHLSILPVMITGMQDAKATIEAIRLGAFDYIRKPLDLNAVLAVREKAQQHLMTPAHESTPLQTNRPPVSREIIGAHPAIIEVLKKVARLADQPVPVLIYGESGTGKELVARALHDTSCASQPFVAVNCSALVATLLESEMFGHMKGAFTGADRDKPGKLELAGSGVLFLDEIGDLPLDLQAKLLRVLQEREFERVGGVHKLPFSARVVAATHRDLSAMVQQGTFREDLFYRLAVAVITVPPLRERMSDLPLLVETILGTLGKELHRSVVAIEPEALALLQQYPWPGNVRELQNVLTRALLLLQGKVLTHDATATALGQPLQPVQSAGVRTLREAEREAVEVALRFTKGNVRKAADLLDISRVTLRKKMLDFGLARGHLDEDQGL
jgi:two-component system response regulator AtoC